MQQPTTQLTGVADKHEEFFDVVDSNNKVIGMEKRSIVHRTGLLHRAVYVWIFNEAGELLLQRRSPSKKIGPDQWDLSVAEHLQPGESYSEGGARGMAEELGIVVPSGALQGPLAPAHLRKLETEDGFKDYEFVESYRVDGWQGPVQPDAAEVCEVRWCSLPQLRKDIQHHPQAYTQWLKEEFDYLHW